MFMDYIVYKIDTDREYGKGNEGVNGQFKIYGEHERDNHEE